MSYGGTLYDDGRVAALGDVAVAAVSRRARAPLTIQQARQEIDALRSINAHLVRQIEQLKQREAHAPRLADRDGLTGLYNRRKMMALLDHALVDATQHGECVGLLFIDLDGFKAVNDRFGHTVGDKLLTMVASRLGARARIGDYVCRYGGDEFVIILSRSADCDSVYRVADSVARRIALPYCVDGIDLQVTAAVGISMFPDEARDAADLMARADESMYRAKSAATGCLPVPLAPPARRHDDPLNR